MNKILNVFFLIACLEVYLYDDDNSRHELVPAPSAGSRFTGASISRTTRIVLRNADIRVGKAQQEHQVRTAFGVPRFAVLTAK